ncbi:MAG: hypothetical protein A3K10_09225 [Bacteroidetes bacterium RIFCSPLOWO2_12_FULL_31_6]|nr:MAG: hypothetical protein A3K10_09225 [Bacteroidetes bacterium RIFCSPLOWO2_12_FULL_31_6]
MFIIKYDSSGNELWAKGAEDGNNNYDNYGPSVATDALGNVYWAGNFWGKTITFGTTSFSNTAGTYDMFFVKYDKNGNLLWAKNPGGTLNDNVNSIVVDSFANIYLVGSYRSYTCYFDTITLTCGGSTYTFIAKYDSSGSAIWAKQAGYIGVDIAFSCYTDSSGNIYTVGSFDDINFAFDSLVLTELGYSDIFIVKYNPSGVAQWAKSAGGNYYDEPSSINVDRSGNVYITGYFNQIAYFDSITLTSSTSTGEGMFIAKYADSMVTDINAISNDNTAFIVYPNPVNEELNIIFSENISNANAQIQIYSLEGKLIITPNLTIDNDLKINFSESNFLQNGVYLIKVVSDVGTFTSKFIKW